MSSEEEDSLSRKLSQFPDAPPRSRASYDRSIASPRTRLKVGTPIRIYNVPGDRFSDYRKVAITFFKSLRVAPPEKKEKKALSLEGSARAEWKVSIRVSFVRCKRPSVGLYRAYLLGQGRGGLKNNLCPAGFFKMECVIIGELFFRFFVRD